MADLAAAIPLADAVLFEGYVLYPYRANDAKNQVRWQFGVLVPPAFAELDPSERAWLRSDLLVEGRGGVLTVRVRFLHARERTVQRATSDGFQTVPCLDVGEATYLPCDEASVEQAELTLPLPAAGSSRGSREVALPGGTSVEDLHAADGQVLGRLVRSWLPITAQIEVATQLLPGPYGVHRARVHVENRTPWTATTVEPSRQRPAALRQSLLAAHVLAGVDDGRFISQLDPPEWARGYVAACEHVGSYPVLAGPAGSADIALAAPIVLYDHAQVAPESEVAFCDATEMDEMLTLRALTLTDEEKRQARGSDARAAGIVDQVDNLPPELLDRLHGVIRSMAAVARPADQEPSELAPWWDPAADSSVDPDTDEILVGGVAVRRGVRVRLRPGRRRADAQDIFLDGRLAHVEAVLHDVDGQIHLAVALDDLTEDGVNPHGRFLYFAPDEVEPIEDGT
jgi:hypothetical protein